MRKYLPFIVGVLVTAVVVGLLVYAFYMAAHAVVGVKLD